MGEWMTEEEIKKRINGMLFEILPGYVTLGRMEMMACGMLNVVLNHKVDIEKGSNFPDIQPSHISQKPIPPQNRDVDPWKS